MKTFPFGRRRAMYFLVAGALVSTACDRNPMIPLAMNKQALSALTADDLDARERALLEELMKDVPADLQVKTRKALSNPHTRGSSQDPREDALMRELNALRDVRDERRKVAAPDQPAAKATDAIRVDVAFVPNLPNNARAVVHRKPHDEGVALILIREDASEADLDMGLALARKAFAKYGKEPSHAARAVAKLAAGEKLTATPNSKILKQLRDGLAAGEGKSKADANGNAVNAIRMATSRGNSGG